MFKIIEPKEQGYYRARIDLLIGLMKLKQDLPLCFAEQACSTFIIGEEQGAIYGGAILQKQHINSLPDELRASLSTFILNMKYVWVCTLALCLEDTGSSSESACGNLSETFYFHLLKKLNEFGTKRNVGFLCLTLNPFEHLKLQDNEFWSCIFEINPKKTSNGLFYGILPLSQQKCKSSPYKSPYQEPTSHFQLLSHSLLDATLALFKEKTFIENIKTYGILKDISYIKQTLSKIKDRFTKYSCFILKGEEKLKKIKKDKLLISLILYQIVLILMKTSF